MKKINFIFMGILFLMLIFLYKPKEKSQLENLKAIDKILYSNDGNIVYSLNNQIYVFDLDKEKQIKFPVDSSDMKIIGNIGQEIFYIKNNILFSNLNLTDSFSLENISEVEILGKFIKIQKNEKFGIIDQNFKEVLAIEYDRVAIGEKLFLAQKNKKFGYLDFSGKIQIPFEYDYAMIDKDKTIVVSKNKKARVIDFNNREIISSDYNYLIYNDGIALARREEKFYKVTKENEELLDVSWIGLNNDKTIFYEKNKNFGLMLLSGEKLTENIYDEILQKNIKSILVKQGENYGLINQEGQPITELKYSYLYPLHSYFFLGLLEGSFEEILINSDGKEVNKLGDYLELKEVGENYFILNDKGIENLYFKDGTLKDKIDRLITIQKNYLIYENDGKIKKLRI